MLYKSQMIVPQHHHRNKKKQTKPTNVPQSNQQPPPSQTAVQPQAVQNQPNVNNNNNNQVNFNSNNANANEEAKEPTANVSSAPKNSIPEISNEDNITVGHNGARLSNTSTTTTVTTLSTSTTTTATSGPATTSSSNATQQQQQTTAQSEETNLTRRKSSSITASMSTAALPNSQSMELKNSQINLSMKGDNAPKKHPQPPTHIDIQPVNTAPISSTAHRNSHGDDTESGQSTPTKRNINKMRREHKAAKTLGT